MKAALIVALAGIFVTVSTSAEPLLEKTDLFDAGEEGYALYRIPGIVVTKSGTALAYCEARRDNKGDWGQIDIVMRRSIDGGKSWLPRQTIVQVEGELPVNPLAAAQDLDSPGNNTANNPVMFADRDGSVHLLYCLEYARCYYLRSDDDGESWSEPLDITETFEAFRPDYDWKILATGPGHGIQLSTGRLIIPVWLSLGTGNHAHRPSVTSVVFSDDHGKTWERGGIALPDTKEWVYPNETAIVENVAGSVIVNARSESPNHRRLVNYSRDGGETWARPRFDEALLEPICMGSLVRYSKRPEADRNRILFSNPHNLERLDGKEAEGKSRDRRNLSVQISYDEVKTWKYSKALEAGYGAYSDLAVLPNGEILCLYERGREPDMEEKKSTSYAHLTVARFNLEWLTDGRDSLNGPLNGKSDFGRQRDDFEVAGCEAFVIHPDKPLPGGKKPWVWYAPTIGNNPGAPNTWLLDQLLGRGFHVAGIYVGETFANPESRDQFEQFYRFVRKSYDLDEKACLLAQSRGGLNHYNFAADHPDRVRCIAGIYTVGDLESFPGLERAAPAYGMTVTEFRQELALHNPVERLAPLAKAKIPILHLHGDSDKVVPIEQNSSAIAERYRALGGEMELVVVPGKGHQYDPGFFESVKMLRFLELHALGKTVPLFETVEVFPVAPNNKPNYRIPALLQADNGDLLVFAEKRNDGPGDIGNHDIVLKRSSNRGRTWGEELVIFDDGDRVCTDLTVGREESGKLWLFFLRDKKEYCHFTSLDHGATWEGPTSIHDQVTRPEWEQLPVKETVSSNPKGRMAQWEAGWSQRYGCGPGNAMVQMKSGRLIVPARHREDTGGGKLRSFAHAFHSDDLGETWKLGGTIGIHTSECQFLELSDGRLMVISRNENADDLPDNLRHLVALSEDGGASWSELRRAEELITPKCHGSVERYDGNTLLFSSPASPFRQKDHPYGRYNLTVRRSEDEGRSWSAGRTVWPHPSSYSDLAALDDGTIGIIYERGDNGTTHYWDSLHFARFTFDWLTPYANAE